MRRLLTFAACALLACAAPAVTACATVEAGGQSVIDSRADERALFVAVQAVRGVAITVEAAVDAGVLKGENAAKAAALLRQARVAVIAAKAAYDAGNAFGAITAANRAKAAVAEIAPLVPAR